MTTIDDSNPLEVNTPRILVIDDEQSILALVNAYLTKEGYAIRTAADGISGLQTFREFHPDLVVLDIMLPGMDGLELLTLLRRESDAYVIMLTAKTDELDKIIGLSVGADDYVTKPFSPRELTARIKAALRRQRPTPKRDENELVYRHMRLYLPGNQVWVEDKLVDLTPLEFQLLKVLAQQHRMVVS